MENYKKKYEQAIENLKKIKAANKDNKELVDFIEYKYPELKESDDRIRKEIIEFLKIKLKLAEESEYITENLERWIDWLEKQGQMPTDKVEPKFKVGDIIRHKRQGCTCKITAINTATTEYEVSECTECNGTHLPFDSQDAYELVEQNPAWSEEDEKGLGDTLWAIQQAMTIAKDDNDMGNLWYAENWLKSLKDRMKGE